LRWDYIMRYLYLFSILLIVSKTFAAAGASSGSASSYEWGIDPEKDTARVVKLASISGMVITMENPDEKPLARSPSNFTPLLDGVKSLLDEGGESVTPEIATVVGHCFTYLVASGQGKIARKYMPIIQTLLDKGLIENIENLNYPGTKYGFGIIQISPGQLGLLMEGYSPRFNKIGRPRLPHEFSKLLLGGGHRYAGTAFSEEDWYGIDFDPGIGPHLIGNAADQNVLGLFEESQIDEVVFEYVAWDGWRSPDGKFSYPFSDLFRILRPGAVVAMLGNGMHVITPKSYLMDGVDELIASAKAAGFVVQEVDPFRGRSHALVPGRPVYEHVAGSVFLTKPGDDESAALHLGSIKEQLKRVRPFPPEALMAEKDVIVEREEADLAKLLASAGTEGGESEFGGAAAAASGGARRFF